MGPTDSAITLLSGITIVVGIIGVIVPVLPGLLLCWLGVLGWAIFFDGGWSKWLVFGVVTAIALVGTVVKYAGPGRNPKRSGAAADGPIRPRLRVHLPACRPCRSICSSRKTSIKIKTCGRIGAISGVTRHGR